MCENRPNLIVAIVQAIKQELASELTESHAFKSNLQNGLDSKTAQALLDKAFGYLNVTYGLERWHSLFRPKLSSEPRQPISERKSLKLVTARIMNCLALDAITGRVVTPLNPVITFPPNLEFDQKCIPTYKECEDSGIFALDKNNR